MKREEGRPGLDSKGAPQSRRTITTISEPRGARRRNCCDALWLIYPLGALFIAYLLARSGDLLVGVLAIVALTFGVYAFAAWLLLRSKP